MARKGDPVRLRPVDDESSGSPPVVRLVSPEAASPPEREAPLRLGAVREEPGARHRLAVPDKDEVELRTHQPGVEALYEPEAEALAPVARGSAKSSAPEPDASTLRPQSLPWGLLAFAALVVGWVLYGVLARGKEDSDPVAPPEPETRIADPAGAADTAETIERLESTLRGFFAADSVEAMAKLVRHPQRVLPLMRAHYHDAPVYTGGLQFVRDLRALPREGREEFWWASVTLETGARHEVVLQLAADGSARVDWETLVCHQAMPWSEFAARRPRDTPLDFRVRVERAAGAEGSAAYRLTAPSSEAVLLGRARPGSEAERALRAATTAPDRADPQPANLILRLRVDAGSASPDAVTIEAVVNQGWIFLESPVTDS